MTYFAEIGIGVDFATAIGTSAFTQTCSTRGAEHGIGIVLSTTLGAYHSMGSIRHLLLHHFLLLYLVLQQFPVLKFLGAITRLTRFECCIFCHMICLV